MGHFWLSAKKVLSAVCYVLGVIASIITIASVF